MIKIFYSLGKRAGAAIQYQRFIAALDFPAEVRVAGFHFQRTFLEHLDLTLDAVYNRINNTPYSVFHQMLGKKIINNSVDFPSLKAMLADMEQFSPDLVICDGEFMAGHCADRLGIPLWYSSPIYLVTAIQWSLYTSLENKQSKLFQNFINDILSMSVASRTLIPTPFADVEGGLKLKAEFEFITPYWNRINREPSFPVAVVGDDRRTKLFDSLKAVLPKITIARPDEKEIIAKANWILTTGETNILADLLYNGFDRICLAPSMTDKETFFNCSLGANLLKCSHLGQVEMLGYLAPETIEKSFDCKQNLPIVSNSYKFLHELIRESFL